MRRPLIILLVAALLAFVGWETARQESPQPGRDPKMLGCRDPINLKRWGVVDGLTYNEVADRAILGISFADQAAHDRYHEGLARDARRMDANHNGRVSRQEYEAYCPAARSAPLPVDAILRRVAPEMSPVAPVQPVGSHQHVSGTDARIKWGCAIPFERLDFNHLGYFTFDDYATIVSGATRKPTTEVERMQRNALVTEARRMDTNGDGEISRTEFEAACR